MPKPHVVLFVVHLCFLYRDKILNLEYPLRKAVQLLDEGNIVAVKGIGGTHLVASATSDDAVLKFEKGWVDLINPLLVCLQI